MHRDGAADLQQLYLTGAARVPGQQGGAGLHPEPLALFLIVAIAHGDAVVVRVCVVAVEISHQLLQRLFKALLAAACHAAGEDLALFEEDHGLDAQDIGRAARHLADAAALDEIIQVAHGEEDLVCDALGAQPDHSLFQRAACVPHGHRVFHHFRFRHGGRRGVHHLDLCIGVILQHQLPGVAGAAHTAAHLAGKA